MGIAFIVAIILCIVNGKKNGITSDDVFTLALYVIPLSILGARTYYVIFSGSSFTFLEFLAVWNGGLAILGGVIGGILAVILYCLIHKKNILALTDLIAPSLILGQSIGRIGCFCAGCCYGEEINNTALHFFPIGIQIDGVWHYATMFYECFWCFLCFWLLLFLYRKFNKKGLTTCSYLIVYGFGRFFIEALRGDSLFLFSTGIRVSQALSTIMFIIGIAGLIYILCKNIKKENTKCLQQNQTDTKEMK